MDVQALRPVAEKITAPPLPVRAVDVVAADVATAGQEPLSVAEACERGLDAAAFADSLYHPQQFREQYT